MLRNDAQFLKYLFRKLDVISECEPFQLHEALRRGAAAGCEKREEDVEPSYSDRYHMETGWSWGCYQPWNYWPWNHWGWNHALCLHEDGFQSRVRLAVEHAQSTEQGDGFPSRQELRNYIVDGTTLNTWRRLPVEAAVDKEVASGHFFLPNPPVPPLDAFYVPFRQPPYPLASSPFRYRPPVYTFITHFRLGINPHCSLLRTVVDS